MRTLPTHVPNKKFTEFFSLLHVLGKTTFWRGTTFSLVFLLSLTYLQKVLLLLPLMSLSRFNSIRALPYLTLSLAAWTTSVYSSQAIYPCFHPL